MKLTTICFSLAALLSASLASQTLLAQDTNNYEVTITNLTRGQTFTPVLVASHEQGVEIFTLGQPASAQLATLAESGDVSPLAEQLESNPQVRDVANSDGLLMPGQSVTVTVSALNEADYISLASMLIPTNDGFVALNGVKAPSGSEIQTYRAIAYDAGSEPNDELCANIPGPVCGGVGGSPEASGENYVHTHAGIHGIGDLAPADYDWRNPVAAIQIRRTQ